MGTNAADAAVISQVAVGLLRQQLPDDHRVGLFVKEAGDVTNIIPETSVVDFECRAFTMDDFQALVPRVHQCFEGAAVATGASLEISATQPVYESLIQDEILADGWTEAMASFGHNTSPSRGMSGGSTDMGNISQVIPSLHPWLSILGLKIRFILPVSPRSRIPRLPTRQCLKPPLLWHLPPSMLMTPKHRSHFIQYRTASRPSGEENRT